MPPGSDAAEPLLEPAPESLPFLEDLWFRWRRDPSSVEEGWRRWFERLPAAPGAAEPPGEWPRRAAAPPTPGADEATLQERVGRLVQAFREQGHLRTRLDPLGLIHTRARPFELAEFGLGEADGSRVVSLPGFPPSTVAELGARLEETYCRTLGVELAHLRDRDMRRWLKQRMERTRNRIGLAAEVKRKLLAKLVDADLFEGFLGTRFLGAKRFSLEGGEGLVPLLELVIDRAAGHGVRNLVIGMAHRGRLNVLANVLGKPLRQIFSEFQDRPGDGAGAGDVKYHLGFATDRATPEGGLHLSLAFNPSHLEWIDPVVVGRVRAKQDRYRDGERRRSLPVLIHGDAAFAGQGIVAEVLNLSLLDGYAVGGTIHVVVNNQVGFTTPPREARSTPYATDVARMLDIPIFHVNGEDLESIAQAVLLAVDFRQQFHRNVVIDLWCYRRHGHNEGDEPAFTQPLMAQAIAGRPPLRVSYGAALVAEGVLSADELTAMEQAARARLEAELVAAAGIRPAPAPLSMEGAWTGHRGGPFAAAPPVATAVDAETLAHIGRHLTEVPAGFVAHPKIVRLLEQRAAMMAGKRPLDWGAAEALALGSLAWEGAPVRLAGQDSQRGTFSHRHAVLHDQRTGAPYLPLAHLREGQAEVEVVDSPLSEAAALGFEYGYSLEMPEGLVVWEAQFGDFANAAQVIVDQFLSSSETKWNRLSGLALLLPHGLEGQGPEHSSARLERFLELSVDDNWTVANLTTPAQLFHALRRQVRAPWRKPLVILSPKGLLRHPAAVSSLAELTGGGFQPVLADPADPDPARVTRVCLCSGKIFHELAAARDAGKAGGVALLRLEQLYPLPEAPLRALLERYPGAVEVAWVQEEPRNMGACRHADLHLAPLLPRGVAWRTFARPPSAAPASGSASRHAREQQALVREALDAPAAPGRARARG